MSSRSYLPGEDMTGFIPGSGHLSRERYEMALAVIYQLSIGKTYGQAARVVKRSENSCKDMIRRTGQMWGVFGVVATVSRAIRMGFVI